MSTAKSAVQYTAIFTTEIVYARAFFLTSPAEHPLMPGETRLYPFKWTVGSRSPATGFRLDWYATRADADARRNKLTDTDRLPSAEFLPATPSGTDADALQDGTVILTAPASNGYENPVGIIEMVQDTGDFIKPHIYLLNDTLETFFDVEFREYQFRYWIGHPAIDMFEVAWYANRLDANLMVDRLTDADRLPRAVFIPATPNTEGVEAETLQNGILRLYRPVSDTPYKTAVGLLCVRQGGIKIKGDPKSEPVSPIQPPRRRHNPTWEIQ